MAAHDACISLAGLVVDLVIIMAVLTVSMQGMQHTPLPDWGYVFKTRCSSGLDSSDMHVTSTYRLV